LRRVVYLVFSPRILNGGNKVTFRHVEALTALGFDAVVRIVGGGTGPTWFRHAARMEDDSTPLRDDDILVLPEDNADALRRYAGLPNRKLVFCQNPYYAAAGLGAVDPATADAYRSFIACSQGVGAWISRFFDYDRISVVPGFADERLFAPAAKSAVIACIPRKRPMEARAIHHMFTRLYAGPTPWRWTLLEDVTEAEVAGAMAGAAVFLSLNRFEGMALTTVEAMASSCLVAGFTGLGPREYATSINGFWVEEDDCEACARALVRACVLADENAGGAELMRHAARATAHQWSYAAFVRALEDFWRGELG
jgi:hypothetical protein